MDTDSTTFESLCKRTAAMNERERVAWDKRKATLAQVMGQMRAAIDRVMGEASLYAPEHAAIALLQADGDTTEASQILRAFRESIARRYTSEIVDTEGMQIERRISSAFREIPGGQILGPTRDYTQRLLDETLAGENAASTAKKSSELQEQLDKDAPRESHDKRYPRVSDLLNEQGLIKDVDENEDRRVVDITKTPITYPAPRSAALQTLARAETGGMMALGYSAMRGQGGDHPTIGELRVGSVKVYTNDPRGRRRLIGRIRVTESANISKIKVKKRDPVPYMSLGYGLCFGQNETKAICMGILDRSMRIPGDSAPAISQEFVLHHLEGPDSQGYVSSLKMPAHVAFKSEVHDLQAAIKRKEQKRAADLETSKKAEPQTELA